MSIDSHRPWGFFEDLDEKTSHKIKRITVFPGKRLSLQLHRKRSEHWYLVQGNAVITLNGETLNLSPGESIDIGREDMHRIQNTGNENLVFIEVQTGDYFGEDDIERFEDDFGRV